MEKCGRKDCNEWSYHMADHCIRCGDAITYSCFRPLKVNKKSVADVLCSAGLGKTTLINEEKNRGKIIQEDSL
jgi:hypothetical protein